MYGGGYNGGWNPWGGGGGASNNANMQGTQQQRHQGPHQGVNQSQSQLFRSGINQGTQSQQQMGGYNNAVGFSGYGAGNGTAMMGFQGGVVNRAIMANNAYGYQGATMNMNPNPYMLLQQQQQNSFMQQQQAQQNANQPVFQTNVGYARPQPPLPPGPPPTDTPTRQPLFGSLPSQPPLPSTANAQPPAPVPPPPPPDTDDSHSKNNATPQIPDAILKLLQNAEVARQFQQAAESLSAITPLMALNVSQELFGSKSSNKGIPGLDFSENDGSTNTDLNFKKEVKKPLDLPLPPGSVETEKSTLGAASSKDTANNFETSNSVDGHHSRGNNDEIVWQTRDELNDTKSKEAVDDTHNNIGLDSHSILHKNSDQQQSGSDVSAATKDQDDVQKTESFAATIPLQKDGKPVEYDRKTLRAFDKKFRDWEHQFEDWKTANQNHPDITAYTKYMNQWNLWREQLIEQRRFIIDSMNKARLEAEDMSIHKSKSVHGMVESQVMQDELGPRNTKSTKAAIVSPSKPAANLSGPSGPPLKANAPPPPTITQKSGGRFLPPPNFNSNNKPEELRKSCSNENANANWNHEGNQKRLPFAESKFADSQRGGPAPVPLFDINITPDDSMQTQTPHNLQGINSTSVRDQHKDDRDRPVERIPRDRDRPGLAKDSGFPKSNANNNSNQKKPPNSERVARDPHENKNANNPFSLDEVTWEMPQNTSFEKKNSNSFEQKDVNPFEVAQNPFVQASNPFMWDQSGSGRGQPEVAKLPTLSDFLNKDDCKVTDDYLNRRGFGTRSESKSLELQRDPKNSLNLEFEATSKLLPLVIGKKPKNHESPPPPVEPAADEVDASSDPNTQHALSQWFTRDRGGVFEEDEFAQEDSFNEGYSDNAPAVIDYGHGATAADDDEFDIPRCERMANREVENDYSFQEDDDTPSNAVTIDYGHGSVPAKPPVGLHSVPVPYGQKSDDDYYEESHYEQYGRYESPAVRSRGRGRGGPMIRGGGRGRGRGNNYYDPDPHYSTNREFEHDMSHSHDEHRPVLHPPIHGPRELMTPSANRGKGRGMPTRFGGTFEEYSDDADQGRDRFRARKSLPETEQVNSPEVILVDTFPTTDCNRRAPPRDDFSSDRRAPPRDDSSSDRRAPPRDDSSSDRRAPPRDDSSSDRRYSNRKDEPRTSSRDRERDSNAQSRFRDNGDRHRVRRDPDSFDDRHKSDRERYSWEYEEESKSKRDELESPRSSRRERDNNRGVSSNEHGRTRRSRSRSPINMDRAAARRDLSSSQSSSVNSRVFPSSSNPPAPRYQTVLIEDLLNLPGRAKRPGQIVIILRGLPGSGKSHVAKLIKDKEVEMGESAPRILSLDGYFMQETVKVSKDSVSKQEVKETVMEYEYEADLEPKYRNDLVRTLKKNIENGYFPFIIVDCVNDQVRHFEEMANFAIQRKFQVYIVEVEDSVETCVKRNIHHRTRDQIMKIHRSWQSTPSNYVKLDVRTLLQDEAVQHVEMEDVSDTENIVEDDSTEKKDDKKAKNNETVVAKNSWEDEDAGNGESQYPEASKWEKIEPSEEKLNRLDGLGRKRSGKDEDKVDSNLSSSIESWLQSHLPEDYTSRQQTRPGQKRVRWADIEEKRAQERMRDVGFVVGHTDWRRMTDPTFGDSALTRTKYI